MTKFNFPGIGYRDGLLFNSPYATTIVVLLMSALIVFGVIMLIRAIRNNKK